MKKLNFKNVKLEASEVLQRNQLKTVLGGNDNLPGEDVGGYWVKCNDGTMFEALNCDWGADYVCAMYGGWTVCA